MSQESINRQFIEKYIDKDKWWDVLSKFITVLHVNIFMIDANGGIFLPPEESRYGGRLLTDVSLGFDLLKAGNGGVLGRFESHGDHLEAVNRYELRSYALPIRTSHEEVLAYLVIGPVILNARLEMGLYRSLAHQYNAPADDVVDEILQIRVVSHIMMMSILNLFKEMIKDRVNHKIAQKELEQIKSAGRAMPASFNRVADEIYATVRKDELLATLLDVAMNMTQADCGSIMLLDEKGETLTVKASRGLTQGGAQSVQRLGDGIAGWAAAQNQALFIDDETHKSNNRIAKWLKRPDIREAAVVPLVVDDKVLGVLNLHTKSVKGKIQPNIANLQHLSGLLSSAL